MLTVFDLIGRTVFDYKVDRNNDDQMTLFFTDGHVFHMYHQSSCCESVSIEDIEGDLNDLIGRPLVVCEESSNNDPNAVESGMWTFYRFATDKGYVTVRWYGSSNGYYSEAVDTSISFDNATLERGCEYLRQQLHGVLPQPQRTRSALKI